jgi:ketosteroid isomerase-like protein
MLKRSFTLILLSLALSVCGLAQNANSTSTRQRTSTPAKTTKSPAAGVEESGAQETPARTPAPVRVPRTPPVKDVTATVNALIDGIRKADVKAVTSVYWNSPQLVLFNNNGTVTKGWEQMRINRESSYPNLKDVKLDVRDLRVQMLGRDGAVANFLWTQSQTYKGTAETATGRTTLVLRRIGPAWKIVHLHTSPDSPDQSRVLSSEQTTPTPTPKPTP